MRKTHYYVLPTTVNGKTPGQKLRKVIRKKSRTKLNPSIWNAVSCLLPFVFAVVVVVYD